MVSSLLKKYIFFYFQSIKIHVASFFVLFLNFYKLLLFYKKSMIIIFFITRFFLNIHHYFRVLVEKNDNILICDFYIKILKMHQYCNFRDYQEFTNIN